MLRECVSPEDEARAFRRMRCRILAALLRQTLSQARFRASLIVVLTALLWSGMFWMFADGFRFLQTTITHSEIHTRTVGAVFGAFFAALMLMLVFSSGVILYGSLFCSKEAAFLLTIPSRTERVFLHKFQEAIILSSWGFVLLGSPMLLAHGVVEHAPWYYYAMLPPFLVAFIYIPVAIGAIICLWVVHRIPASRLAVLIGGGCGGGVWIAWLLLAARKRSPDDGLVRNPRPAQFSKTAAKLVAKLRLLNAAASAWSESILFLTLTIPTHCSSASWRRTAGRIYRTSYSGLYGRRCGKRPPRLTDFSPGNQLPVRSRAAYDDQGPAAFPPRPLQWSQFLILGLLALYSSTSAASPTIYVGWVNMVSFLNLGRASAVDVLTRLSSP